MSSKRAAVLLDQAARETASSKDMLQTRLLEVADGGEGTLEAVISVTGGQMLPKTVKGPLLKEHNACYGKINTEKCLIEMAKASGLTLISEQERNPLFTSTYGTGELILDAVKSGFTDITIAIGGSATNDGGMGCMSALGVQFLDQDGKLLLGTGADLGKVASINLSKMPLAIRDGSVHFTVMCDVDNPLCGPNGATYTFGPQKGADGEILDLLEKGMLHYREKLQETFGINPDLMEGAGAAGGLGAALMLFLQAQKQSGIEAVLDLICFDNLIADADLVITGEGRMDAQSLHGKVAYGIGMRCKKQNIPCVAIVGSLGEGAEQMLSCGIKEIHPLLKDGLSLEYAMEHTEELYLECARKVFTEFMNSLAS